MTRLSSLTLALAAALTLPGLGAVASEEDAAAAAEAEKVEAEEVEVQVDHGRAHIDWLRNECGGYFNDKIKIGRLDDSDPSSPMGMFVTEDVAEKETLMIIPQKCLITSGGSENMCDTSRNLLKEMKLGDESYVAPYVNYLMDGRRGQLPAAWSDEGQDVLVELIGAEHYPEYVTEISFEDRCGGGTGDPLEEDAYLFVISRSWDDVVVPVLDMMNHRNGKWKNVDSNSAHEGKDITAYATRNIEAGEQLHLSYNECTDCRGIAHEYVLPHILKDYGFVEQFPQRWKFDGEDRDLLFELDERESESGGNDSGDEEDGPELELTWLKGEPNAHELNMLRGHLQRLHDLEEWVYEEVKDLTSDHEMEVIIDFYEGLTTALEYAIANPDNEYTETLECVVSASAEEEDVDPEEECGDLHKEMLEPEGFPLCNYGAANAGPMDEYETIDEAQSHYQFMKVVHDDELNDTCFFLEGHLHVCTAFSPHYHELVVHYASRFLPKVRRVIYLGGGDSMLLREILKYPSLELVVGMELDQQVVRSSFEHFGTRPYFEDDRVDWWFGDAAKSLLVLPEEYFGSFDLVIVDLALSLADTLKVTEDLTIMEAAGLLLGPGGVLVKNEDEYENFYRGEDPPAFTTYNAYFNYMSVPMYCHQSFSLGSDEVDFLNRKHYDHGVDTIFLDPVDKEGEDRFDMWYNYKRQKGASSRGSEACAAEPNASDEKRTETKKENRLGLLMIVEAENAAIGDADDGATKESLGKALKEAGLTEISSEAVSSEEMEESVAVFILREGYVLARLWPEHKYCAFDIFLWSEYQKQDIAKEKLIAAVGSTSSSSYRIVAGGMFGDTGWTDDGKKFDKSDNDSEVCESPDSAQDTPARRGTVDAVVSESLSLIEDTDALVAVFCGETSRPCGSMSALAEEEEDAGERVIPVPACRGVDEDAADADDGAKLLTKCLADTMRLLRWKVSSGGSKIGAIVIDPEAPRAMGEVLIKILGSTKVRRELLSEHYVVAVVETTADPSVAWRKELLEQFRLRIDTFDPAYRAEVSFRNATADVELGLFSSGDDGFYGHLLDMIARVEERTGLTSEVQDVKNGLMAYTSDFEPDQFFTHEDYEPSSALEQWSSQEPLGRQTIFSFRVQPPEDTSTMRKALQGTILSMEEDDIDYSSVKVYDDVGDGCVIVAVWSEGSVILSWDGRDLVAVNVFTRDQSTDFGDEFQERLEDGDVPVLATEQRDEQPRGYGRVVNFEADVGTPRVRVPRWAAHMTPDDEET